MANVTWDSANKGAGITLTGGLTATSTLGASGVFATSGQASGKYYFEYTLGSGTVGSATHVLGLLLNNGTVNASGSAGGAKLITASASTVQVNVNGAVLVAAFAVGAMGSGTVICCALDMDNQRIWFRVGAAGNWNGSSGNDPGTPSTGASLASIGAKGISLVPHIEMAVSGSALTANFGDSAFAGTVPTGFTSGFPTGGANNALFTQEGVEVWQRSPANAQFTQLGAEVWRVGPANVQITQIGVEVWRSVANAPAAATIPAFAMILA